MSLEVASNISQLDTASPSGTDRLAQGDDHIRLIKAVLKATFPHFTGPLDLSNTEINALTSRLVPFGIIVDWYGTAETVPSGWALCNGATVARSDGAGTITTPDLRNRVVCGASDDFDPGDTFGQAAYTVTTGAVGNHTHVAAPVLDHSHGLTIEGTALTINQMPAHNHGIGIADDSVGINRYLFGTKSVSSGLRPIQDSASGSSDCQGLTETIGGGATHTHAGMAAAAGAHTHVLADAGGHAHAVTVPAVQPTYALHKIMRV